VPPVDGRRPTYLRTLPLLVIGSIGVCAAKSIPSLVFWRFFQSMGAAPGWVLGGGVIGDVFRLEERGRAMGIFLAASEILSITWDILSDVY
jgi:MFS family permease